MKNIKFIGTALCVVASLFGMTSCMDKGDDWNDDATASDAYGNNSIQETNVVTLAQLREIEDSIPVTVTKKDDAGNVISSMTYMKHYYPYDEALNAFRGYQEVTHDVQLKLRVVGNDIGGNIYNKVAMQDDNGEAIFVCVYAGGMYSYLPVGQEVLINLKGLYVGTYGYQPQIGTPYTTSSGNTYAGRMANNLWQEHFKLLGYDPTAANCQPIVCTAAEFAANYQQKRSQYAGRLFTLKGVTIKEADGTATYSYDDGANFSISRHIEGLDESYVFLYTSTSAKFGGNVMPTGKVDITGVFSRYNNYWQILLRNADDVQPSEE